MKWKSIAKLLLIFCFEFNFRILKNHFPLVTEEFSSLIFSLKLIIEDKKNNTCSQRFHLSTRGVIHPNI